MLGAHNAVVWYASPQTARRPTPLTFAYGLDDDVLARYLYTS